MASKAAGGLKRSFAPVTNADTRILIVGSLPGDVSLRQAQYYAHPRNQFWRLLEPIVDARLQDVAYDARLATLLAAGVGLWDVVRSARRAGSLDAAIRDWRRNDLAALATALPSLRAIAFNGGKAAAIGRRQLGSATALTLIALPSSSPALTTPLHSKQAAWDDIRRFLAGPPHP